MNVGFASALPTLLQFVVKLFAGYISDKIYFLGEASKVYFKFIAFFKFFIDENDLMTLISKN